MSMFVGVCVCVCVCVCMYFDFCFETPRSFTKSFECSQQWYSSTFGPGDIVLFNIKLIHAATKNYNQTFRIR
jgi:hypothetical protein